MGCKGIIFFALIFQFLRFNRNIMGCKGAISSGLHHVVSDLIGT